MLAHSGGGDGDDDAHDVVADIVAVVDGVDSVVYVVGAPAFAAGYCSAPALVPNHAPGAQTHTVHASTDAVYPSCRATGLLARRARGESAACAAAVAAASASAFAPASGSGCCSRPLLVLVDMQSRPYANVHAVLWQHSRDWDDCSDSCRRCGYCYCCRRATGRTAALARWAISEHHPTPWSITLDRSLIRLHDHIDH